MTVTKILGQQAGIQYQGVKDKSEADPRDHLVNALFTGQFKRGPFNKPFKVTQANIRARLGFDPENLHYQAIEDLLKKGAPFVWVQRVDTELKWGPWELDQAVSITGNMARYTGFKTNSKNAFDSFAEIDLSAAVTASLANSDTQQWQAVKDACKELTGVADWMFDSSNNYLKYYPQSFNSSDPTNPTMYCYYVGNGGGLLARTVCSVYPQEVCNAIANSNGEISYPLVDIGSNQFGTNYQCQVYALIAGANPSYDPNAGKEEKTISLQAVAQKIISNASSSDQGISLFAETYIEEAAKRVSLEELIQQFEQNKVKR